MRRVLAFVLFVSCSGVVRAQSTNASLSGRVTDPSGGVIVGAQVAAINTGTNFRYHAATNGDGQYYLANLPRHQGVSLLGELRPLPSVPHDR